MRIVPPAAAGLLIVSGLTGCGGGGGTPPVIKPSPSPQALATRFEIDGNIDFADFPSTQQLSVDFIDQLGGGVATRSTALRWGIMNDDQDVYIALEWTDDTRNNGFDIAIGPIDFDGVKVFFDDNENGVVDADDDQKTVIAASISSQYIDQYFDGAEQTDRIGDGLGRLAYDASTGTYTAEFLFPLSADQANQDGNLADTTPYNILLYDNVRLATQTGAIATAYPSMTSSAGWPQLGVSSAPVHTRPKLPTNLGGMIAFIGEQDVGANGEIYTFDPATGTVTRVTDLPNLFKDNVSLSHDRTRVAFHGAPSKTDFLNYEIYTVNIDGSNLRQLTSNNILDGHPAWSPDDARLIFASFRDPEGESLITITTDGTEIGDLTPLGFHDNDPDYLPDGRVIFKTDRFSTVPQLRIAVMNEDGSGVQQLTSRTGVSDHDPFGIDGFVLFERFPKGTDFSTDVESGFIGWPIVEVTLAGAETMLLSDGWINWLPLYDPTGGYIAYQKSTGAYTDVRLMTRQGEEIGRLIPGITQIRYIDWK